MYNFLQKNQIVLQFHENLITPGLEKKFAFILAQNIGNYNAVTTLTDWINVNIKGVSWDRGINRELVERRLRQTINYRRTSEWPITVKFPEEVTVTFPHIPGRHLWRFWWTLYHEQQTQRGLKAGTTFTWSLLSPSGEPVIQLTGEGVYLKSLPDQEFNTETVNPRTEFPVTFSLARVRPEIPSLKAF